MNQSTLSKYGEEVALQVSNCYALIKKFVADEICDDVDEIKLEWVPKYFQKISETCEKRPTLEEFKEEIEWLLKPAKPTEAIAEVWLEPWLARSKREKPEKRFNQYLEFLIKTGKEELIEQLEADTFKILDSCHDPNEIGQEWDRRGLVYGHVQSGKTANYIGLINRAFDAGYQVVIVLTGMTEDLRVQTQKRVDEGVIGKGESSVPIGIGKEPGFQFDGVKSATTRTNDLSKAIEGTLGATLSTRDKSIWVIKKNKTVLENLIFWLDKQRSPETGRIDGVPFLIIDDEADNASIQSLSKKDYDQWGEGERLKDLDEDELNDSERGQLDEARLRVIKAINAHIRIALSMMSHKTFVAYTATPYSIINQVKQDVARTLKVRDKEFEMDENSDLFPEHFIIPIKAGKRYLGIDRMFSSDRDKRIPVLKNLDESFPHEILKKNFFVSSRGGSYSFSSIPESLETAILYFILAIITRFARNQEKKIFNSLLIHTSHLTKHADYLAVKTEEFLKGLIDELRSGNDEVVERVNTLLDEMKRTSRNPLFIEYFGTAGAFPERITKNDLLDVLLSKRNQNHDFIYGALEVVSYHSSRGNELKHRVHDLSFETTSNRGKNYIVIGGNRLSRGLTLEGLSVSYFARNSSRQDSLYQMARWFGYRLGYEDLVRVFMPSDHIKWFQSICELENQLRLDFVGLSGAEGEIKMLPRDAAIRMAQFIPDSLMNDAKFPAICDPNKLRHTKKMKLSLCGTSTTTHIVNTQDVQNSNFDQLRKSLKEIQKDAQSSLFVPNENSPEDVRSGVNCNYSNVSYRHIVKLLKSYVAGEDSVSLFATLCDFIEKNNEKLSSWSFVVVNRKNGERGRNKIICEYYSEADKGSVRDELKFVRRSTFKEVSGGRTLKLSSLQDGHRDQIFDIIDDEFSLAAYNETEKRAQVVQRERNNRVQPILLVYLVQATHDETEECLELPMYQVTIPHWSGQSQKVSFITRKSYS